MRRHSRNHRAFTLIELLAVIGIIGVLAALLIPAIKLALQKAEVAQAQNDVKTIEGAVKSFYTEYGKWPTGNGGTLDFSYGAFGSGAYAPTHPASESGSMSSGYCENHWLMETLLAVQDTSTLCGNGGTLSGNPTAPPVNSRGIIFLNIPAKSLKPSTDGTGGQDYVDPWGNPYQVTVDASYDNICSNLAFGGSQAFTPVGTGTVGCVTNTIAVWSFGPLGPYVGHNAKDWITSWQ